MKHWLSHVFTVCELFSQSHQIKCSCISAAVGLSFKNSSYETTDMKPLCEDCSHTPLQYGSYFTLSPQLFCPLPSCLCLLSSLEPERAESCRRRDVVKTKTDAAQLIMQASCQHSKGWKAGNQPSSSQALCALRHSGSTTHNTFWLFCHSHAQVKGFF